MEFTAIDFETANRRSDSACQLAAVVVEAGAIVDQRCWLIRPRPFFFSGFNIQIHGIRPEDVEQEPEFADLWPEIQAFIGNRCVVAHNAAFDIKVLTACLETHRLDVPELRFTCTRLIAKQTWPRWGRYGLKPVSDRLGIRFQHHDALEDSLACAKVLLAASSERQCTSLESLEQALRIERGQCGPLGYRGARMARGRRSGGRVSSGGATRGRSRLAAAAGEPAAAEPSHEGPLIDVHRLMLRAEMVRSLCGKRVCISGSFRALSGDQVEALVRALGGEPHVASDSPADIWIQGVAATPQADQAVAEQAAEQAAITWSEQQFLEQLVSESTFC